MNIVIRPIQAPQITNRGGGGHSYRCHVQSCDQSRCSQRHFLQLWIIWEWLPLEDHYFTAHNTVYIYLNGVKGHWLSSIQECPIPHFVVSRATYRSHATTYIACVFSHPFPPHSPLITHTFTHLLHLHTLAHSLTINWLWYYTKFHTLYSMFRDNDNQIIVLQKNDWMTVA